MKNKNHLKINFLLSLINILLVASSAFADTTALDFNALGTTGRDYYQNTSYSLGWKFTVNKDIDVTSLGFYDDLGNGLSESHGVGIYDLSCQLLATTTVAPSDPLTGFFRFHDITPVTLHQGTQYYIAAVTGAEKYAISVTTLNVNSAIGFDGFSIFGGTQPSSTLQCPNGSQSAGFHGDFGPTFRFVDSGTANPGDANKRATALTLFCNRSGPNLETAKCTATVADTGAPPRSLPTGAINFEASSGFFPSAASCVVVQTPLSPGIGACDVQFTVPTGFLIGAKFPINATYVGDDAFKTSSTSHKLIIPACVGTTEKPCPNSIGLSFDGYPQLLKNKLSILLACGSGISKSALSARAIVLRDQTPASGGTCSANAKASISVKTLFGSLTYPEALSIGEQVSDADAEKDVLLKYFKHVQEVQNEERWKIVQETQELILKIQQDVTTNKIKVKSPNGTLFEDYIKSATLGTTKTIKKFDKSLTTETVNFDVKADKQKSTKLAMPKRIQTLAGYFRKAGVATLPLDVTIKVKQKKRKGTATISDVVEVAVK